MILMEHLGVTTIQDIPKTFYIASGNVLRQKFEEFKNFQLTECILLSAFSFQLAKPVTVTFAMATMLPDLSVLVSMSELNNLPLTQI